MVANTRLSWLLPLQKHGATRGYREETLNQRWLQPLKVGLAWLWLSLDITRKA